MYIENMSDRNLTDIAKNAELGHVQGIIDINNNPAQPLKMIIVLDEKQPEKQLSYIFGEYGLVACIDYASYDYFKKGKNNYTLKNILSFLATDEKYINTDNEYQKIALQKYGNSYFEKLTQKYQRLTLEYEAEVAELNKEIDKLTRISEISKTQLNIEKLQELYDLKDEINERICLLCILDLRLYENFRGSGESSTPPPQR